MPASEDSVDFQAGNREGALLSSFSHFKRATLIAGMAFWGLTACGQTPPGDLGEGDGGTAWWNDAARVPWRPTTTRPADAGLCEPCCVGQPTSDAGGCDVDVDECVVAADCDVPEGGCVVAACTQGECKLEVDPLCVCEEDADPCTVAERLPAAADADLALGACRYAVQACPDDGIACTADVCDSDVGCRHIPEDDACEVPSSCQVARCDPEQGCVLTPQPDGTPCGFSSCGQSQQCWAGECTVVGKLNPTPDCSGWYTPGENGMLPWSVAACSSASADGLFPGGYERHGYYLLSSARVLALPGGRLFVASGSAGRWFDGIKWRPAAPIAPPGPYSLLGAHADGRLLFIRRQTDCPQVLALDLESGEYAPFATSMFEADPCSATGVEQLRPESVQVAPNGSLWALDSGGLFRFDGSRWQKQSFPDVRGYDEPTLVFDDRELLAVAGAKSHLLWRRLPSGQFEAVDLRRGRAAYWSGARTPDGSVLVTNGQQVWRLSADGRVVDYPRVPTNRSIVQLRADRFGRPIVGAGTEDWKVLYRYSGKYWEELGWAGDLDTNAQHDVFVLSKSRIGRLEGRELLPLDPQYVHRPVADAHTVLAYDMQLMNDGPVFDWVHKEPAYENPTKMELRRGALRSERWETEVADLLAVAPRCLQTNEPGFIRGLGERTLVSCATPDLLAREGTSLASVNFKPSAGSEARRRTSGSSIALADDGTAYVAYLVKGSESLHIAVLDASLQWSADLVVPGARVPAGTFVNETPMLDLALLPDGLAVLWQTHLTDDPEDSTWRRHAALFRDGEWSALPDPPEGYAAVDEQGNLWRTGATYEQAWPAMLKDGVWQPVAGGPVPNAFSDSLVFDSDGHPIVAARTGGYDITVLRHVHGEWRGVAGSERAGGVTNSPCNHSFDPRLRVDGNLLCLSWRESVDTPFGLLVRCTDLARHVEPAD